MRTRIFILWAFVLFQFLSIAQERKTLNLADTAKYPPAKCTYRSELKGLAPNTAFLLRDLVQLDRQLQKSDTAIIAKYSLKQTREGIFVGAFLKLPAEFDKLRLTEFGIKVNTDLGSIVTVLIPIEQFISFCKAQIVDYIDIGNKVEPLMDNARSMTNSNLVNQGIELPKGYSGKDVVVGIIDNGFDYTHPTFWDSTMNNFRVKRVWEQTNNSGTTPNGFDYGSEFDNTTDIVNKLYSSNNESHGTHVAGIAAGGGTNIQGCNQYRGIAPESDIVLVATDMSVSGIFHGIAYIVNYAQSVGKPCIINMSLGHHYGPHDGTSLFDQACDTLRSLLPEGVILVGAAGNTGNSKAHFANEFSSDFPVAKTFIGFNNPIQSAGSGIIDIWGSEDFYIQLRSYNINSNNVSGGTLTLNTRNEGNSQYTIYDGDYFSPDACNVDVNIGTYQGKKRISLAIDNTAQDDGYKPLLLSIIANSGIVHMWHVAPNPVNGFYSLDYTDCSDGDDLYTCAEIGGTGNSMISVGAYNSKTSWTDLNGNVYDYSLLCEQGDIANFSSIGPTVDDRIKPDITAPGCRVVSSVNSFDTGNYPINSSDVISSISDGGHNWLYACMQGTSMAAPVVTGILALWLEAYPELTITQAKQLIRETAINDDYTGDIDTSYVNYQNITWGAGKIDAHEGIKRLLQKIPNKHVFNMDTIRICREEQTSISAPEGYGYIWSNGDTTRTIQISQSGNYSVRLVSEEGYKSPWSDTIIVVLYPYNAPIIAGNTDICQGSSTTITVENASSILWSNGQNINSLTVSPNRNRTYGFTMTDEYGCSYSDSVRITVHQPNQVNLVATICQGNTYNENGFNVDSAGTYIRNLQTIYGCDSIVTLNLSIEEPQQTNLNVAICEGSTYSENGFNVDEAGVYIRSLQTINGCDSVITLNLIVNPVASTTLSATICEGSIYTENGFNVSEAGTHTQTLQTVNGCDSIVTLTLTVNPVASTNLSASICEGSVYAENGFNVSEAGTYTQNLQTVNGCDSIVTLNLTVSNIVNNDIVAIICEGSVYSENGFNVSEAGTYTQNLQTINGCDSIVTLTLTVNPVANTTLSATICEGSIYTENGFNVSEAGTHTLNLQTINGCDSIVTLTLTVNPVESTNLTAAICEGTTYTENGFNVSEAGIYTQNLQTVNGCDSIVTLNLTVNPVANTTLSAAICEGTTYTENGFNVSEAGTYTQNLQSVNGCDSIVTLNLTVNPTYNITIDASINEGETYEENGFSESEAGTYVHTLQAVNGCDSVITLNLTVNSSLNDVVANAIEVSLYPNPANAYTTLKVEGLKEQTPVYLFDIQGRKLKEYIMNIGQETLRIDVSDLPKGVYTIMIGNATKKLIVE